MRRRCGLCGKRPRWHWHICVRRHEGVQLGDVLFFGEQNRYGKQITALSETTITVRDVDYDRGTVE